MFIAESELAVDILSQVARLYGYGHDRDYLSNLATAVKDTTERGYLDTMLKLLDTKETQP